MIPSHCKGKDLASQNLYIHIILNGSLYLPIPDLSMLVIPLTLDYNKCQILCICNQSAMVIPLPLIGSNNEISCREWR